MTKIVLFLILCIDVFAKPLDVNVTAKSAILMNAETGKVLYEKNARKLAFPASTTKIASLLYILKHHEQDLNKSYTATDQALIKISREKKFADIYKYPPHIQQTDGMTYYIVKGEKHVLKDLLKAMMVISGNDAANMIAISTCGTVENFMQKLNLYLTEIGCENTKFYNPHGLHYPEHITTAYDLGIMTKEALKTPNFKELFGLNRIVRPRTNIQPPKEFLSYNGFLRNKSLYPYVIGSKSGTSDAGGKNLVTASQKDGRTLICVVLGCENRNDRNKDTIKLFNLAYNEKKKTKKIISKNKIFQAKFKGSSSVLISYLKEDVAIDYYPSEEPNIKAYVQYGETSLPIAKDDQVGYFKVVDENDNILKKVPIFAQNKVKRTFITYLKDKF